MLSADDVGQRVVVRMFAGHRAGRQLFRDVLGELVGYTPEELTVHTRSGPVRIPLAEVHRGKPIPRGLREIEALERVAAAAWPPLEQETLGGWLLRWADGFTGRANAVLPLGEPDRPVEEAVDAAVAWYDARGQRALIDLPMPLAAPLDARLRARGWPVLCTVAVQTVPLAVLRERAPEPDGVVLADTPPAGWLEAVAARRGAPLPVVRQVLTGGGDVAFATAYGPDGAALGYARGAVHGDWLGLFAVETLPAARRRGVAGRITRALADRAAQRGATRAYLQVEESNAAASACWAALGFHTHHTYLRRGAPA